MFLMLLMLPCLNRFYPGKILEWNLGFCLFNQMYNDQFQVRKKENSNPSTLFVYSRMLCEEEGELQPSKCTRVCCVR
jgi:hypothetical protein